MECVGTDLAQTAMVCTVCKTYIRGLFWTFSPYAVVRTASCWSSGKCHQWRSVSSRWENQRTQDKDYDCPSQISPYIYPLNGTNNKGHDRSLAQLPSDDESDERTCICDGQRSKRRTSIGRFKRTSQWRGFGSVDLSEDRQRWKSPRIKPWAEVVLCRMPCVHSNGSDFSCHTKQRCMSTSHFIFLGHISGLHLCCCDNRSNHSKGLDFMIFT